MAGRIMGVSFPDLHAHCLCISGWQLGPWCIALHSGLWNHALWWLWSQKSHQADQQWRISWTNADLRYKKGARAVYWADRSSEWRICPSSLFLCYIRMTKKKISHSSTNFICSPFLFGYSIYQKSFWNENFIAYRFYCLGEASASSFNWIYDSGRSVSYCEWNCSDKL